MTYAQSDFLSVGKRTSLCIDCSRALSASFLQAHRSCEDPEGERAPAHSEAHLGYGAPQGRGACNSCPRHPGAFRTDHTGGVSADFGTRGSSEANEPLGWKLFLVKTEERSPPKGEARSLLDTWEFIEVQLLARDPQVSKSP